MPIRLWELAGADPELRFSPFVWRIRMALVHKGIDWKGVAWRFTEKEAIAPANSIRVPVIEDGGKWVADSWVIANYLEDTYRARPLFGGPGGRALSRFYTDWTDTVLHPAIFRLVLGD